MFGNLLFVVSWSRREIDLHSQAQANAAISLIIELLARDLASLLKMRSLFISVTGCLVVQHPQNTGQRNKERKQIFFTFIEHSIP